MSRKNLGKLQKSADEREAAVVLMTQNYMRRDATRLIIYSVLLEAFNVRD